ncbi:hypothetical protein [Streptococcus pluranimalium]|uniref:hypothetical protein n=1 Tax=Streptococcus pluranimalium TaxID=82348 RepID=UPI0039EA0F3D
MKPKKYPYSGKAKLIRKELPRFIKLGKIALKSELIEHIEAIAFSGNYQTRIVLKIPRFFNREEKVIMVQLNIDDVVKILNQYK